MISRLFYPLTFLIILTGIAAAGDEIQINKALQNGGSVHLQSGVYILDGPIYIHSNTILSGEPDTILRVSSSSSQWFGGRIGIISNEEAINNVLIEGFQIDGNCENLPSSYANKNGIHDAERAIYLNGFTNQYCQNITVRNMKVYDCFSDGIHVSFANDVNVYSNFISNCQHDGVFYVCVVGGSIISNEVAGITSDCLRLDNSQKCIVAGNTVYSYSGNHNNGAYKHGENGLQAGDESNGGGLKHGSEKPVKTKDIEVYNNTFANNGLQAILLDNVELGSQANVYIHDNKFVDIAGFNTSGTSFEYSSSVSESTSIFNIINQVLSFTYPNKEIAENANIQVIYYNNSFNAHSLVYVDGEGLTCVKYTYNGSHTTHYFNINGLDLWEGDLQHTGNAVYLQGSFNASKLQVTCYNSQGYHLFTNFNITEVPDDSAKVVFNHELWAFVGTLIILGFSIYKNFRRVVTKW